MQHENEQIQVLNVMNLFSLKRPHGYFLTAVALI